MSKGQPSPYSLESCDECAALRAQLKAVRKERDTYKEAFSQANQMRFDIADLKAQLAAQAEAIRGLRDVFWALLRNIDVIEYRDKANLRLGDAVPQYVAAKHAMAQQAGEGEP